MDNVYSQGMINSGCILRFVFEKLLGCAFKGWEVFRVYGCTILANMLSMDEIFLAGMRFLAKDYETMKLAGGVPRTFILER
jgi:hypothetical protein